MTTRVEVINDFLAVNCKPGETLQAVIEKMGSGLPFGCRDGQCGTCIVDVVSGMDFLSPKTEKEKVVLANFPDASPNARLVCQMKVQKHDGLIRLKY
ncbi:MAG: (2Fe-2S)-binding protein [Helicobacteraceae bacterium]|jgi:ferredoxin|nr:(2Fe-2S)-binding protein [Helicobacteraceae bacterium]